MVFDRRGFMKFMAGASVGVMATPVPWKLLDDVSIWSQNWPWIPSNEKGESTYTYAVSKVCPSGAPMKVRMVGGRPVRVLPVDDHPLGGGVTALSVAEVQMMYSPGRVLRPLKRGPDGGFIEVSWKEAFTLLTEKVKEAGNSVAVISGDENGTTTEVLSAFAKSLKSDDVFLMPSEGQCAAVAAKQMNIGAQFGYDIEKSDYVLSLGANLLESWGTVVRNRRIFKESRAHSFAGNDKEPAPKRDRFTLTYAGPVQNATAAVAHNWLPIYPGTEGVLALGIASMLLAKGRMANAVDLAAFKTLLGKYTPDAVAKATGVDLKKLQGIVNELLSAKAPLVIVGSEFNQGGGSAPIMAGFAINALLGNINKVGGMRMLPPAVVTVPGADSREEIFQRDVVQWLAKSPRPAVLIMHEANPVYALPDPAGVKRALKGMPFKVSFTTFMDESAEECDLVLPIPVGIERVDDLVSPYGVGKTIYCVSTLSAEPQPDVIGTANTILHLARALGKDLGYQLYQDALKAKAIGYEKCSFEALVAGKASELDATVPVSGYSLRPDILGRALPLQEPGKLTVAVCSKLSMGTAKTGIPPYNTKTLRASELEGSTMSVMMNGATAGKHNVRSGDTVEIDSGKNKIPAKLHVFEGIMNDTVAISLGFGHTALDEFSKDKGANVMELLKAAPEPSTGLAIWSKTGVKVNKA